MLVDDEPFNLDSMKIVIQCASVEIANFNFKNRIDTARNGLRAVDLLKAKYNAGFTYKLILMDCNMPKMDGYEATRNIRSFMKEIGQEQPFIVALTGHAEEKYIQRALEAEMNTLISKPARIQDLEDIVK